MTTLNVLQLSGDKYYIGTTRHPLESRVLEHFTQSGSEWTKKYLPIKVLEVKNNVDQFEEDKQTKFYMSKYGIENNLRLA